MNKRDAKEIAYQGGKTAKELKQLVAEYGGGNTPSRINKSLTKSQAAQIFRNALDQYEDGHVFKGYHEYGAKSGAILVQNVLRECA